MSQMHYISGNLSSIGMSVRLLTELPRKGPSQILISRVVYTVRSRHALRTVLMDWELTPLQSPHIGLKSRRDSIRAPGAETDDSGAWNGFYSMGIRVGNPLS